MNDFVPAFLELFEEELKQNVNLRNYHRLINSKSSHYYFFRKAYLQERMEFVRKNVIKPNATILDIGCGYGTTSFMLAMLGHNVTGTTLEYYYDQIDNRYQFWKNHFDTSSVEIRYENLFQSQYPEEKFDYIIVQDTLHHLEPIDEALLLFHKILKKDGEIIVCEENGKNIITRLKRFKQRGFKRIIDVYDDRLNIYLKMGNENVRSLNTWNTLFRNHSFSIEKNSIEYIRVLPPLFYKNHNLEEVLLLEKRTFLQNKFFRNYLYFGLNFTVHKQ